MPNNLKFKTHNPDTGGKHDKEISVAFAEPVVENTFAVPEPPPVQQRGHYEPVLVEPKFKTRVTTSQLRDDMDSGMRILLDFLPDDTSDMIRECVKEQDLPLWQVIGGYVMRARESSVLMSPVIMPEWESGEPASIIRPCGTCGDAIKPVAWGQKFCCERCYFGRVHDLGHNDTCSLTTIDQEVEA